MLARDFRIAQQVRSNLQYSAPLFSTDTHPTALYEEAKQFAFQYNQSEPKQFLSPASLHAAALLHTLYQLVIDAYVKTTDVDFFARPSRLTIQNDDFQDALLTFKKAFPSPLLNHQNLPVPLIMEETVRAFFVYQVIQANPALVKATKPLVSPEGFQLPESARAFAALMGGSASSSPKLAQDDDLFTFLTQPAKLHPHSLSAQLAYIGEHWSSFLPDYLLALVARASDYIREEEKPHFPGNTAGPTSVPEYRAEGEVEAYSIDKNWMPNVVMMAKSILVWLDQLSKQYGYPITTLDQIPDKELDILCERGFTSLWLIGLWQRSSASKKIKNLSGNPEAEASAYSLKGYDIAPQIGGWQALEHLKKRCAARGIRLASDMVPNHTGIDSDWIMEHPDYFISQSYSPFPSYTYNGPNLSDNPHIEITLEDHYFDRSDAAVAFRRIDRITGDTRYIFHGNDGTSMPWNDTAQIDFLNSTAREAVIEQIIHVAKNFSIIRFDAAMTLAKKHIQRLWYPLPGQGGDIAGRSAYGLSQEEFDARIPVEFWREVVDRIATELPDTLLLAEAFWMMEGFFVRTLGMHRVYNSAFMNMLKNQENKKYRDTIKNTISFDPEILKRYVNFMNNPDEDTAIAQFGDGDRYFGVCTLLATMPGLPMFGHGQIDGYREKYGMEYRKAYWDEQPDERLVSEHYNKIFPLLRKRYLFSGVEHFQLFDLIKNGEIQESVFAYVNGNDQERALVVYNNQYETTEGHLGVSVPKLCRQEDGSRCMKTVSLAESLGLSIGSRNYTLYRNFSADTWHIIPSVKLYDEGMWCRVEGYQAIVLLDVHQVEDTTGVYQKLYELYGSQGFRNLEEELRLIRLAPIFDALKQLTSEQYFFLMKQLLSGEATAKTEKKLLLLLGEGYVHLTTLMETLDETDFLPAPVRDVTPAQMLKTVQRLRHLVSDEAGTGVFRHVTAVMDELPVILGCFFFISPFLPEQPTLSEAVWITQHLFLHTFYRKTLKQLGFDKNTHQSITLGGALLAGLPSVIDEAAHDNPLALLQTLLGNDVFSLYIENNEYENTWWYRKESFQNAAVLTALALAMREEESSLEKARNLLGTWLEAERHAGYKTENLIHPPFVDR